MRASPQPAYSRTRSRIEQEASGQGDTRSTLLLAVPDADVDLYPGTQFIRIAARTMTAALQQISRAPRFVVIDWDLDGVDGAALCRAATAAPNAGVLVATSDPACVPAALKAGCHAILLKPVVPSLVAARLGRLSREQPVQRRFATSSQESRGRGLNRVWSEIECPYCAAAGPTSFEFCSHRRAWYACLACDRVWLAARLG